MATYWFVVGWFDIQKAQKSEVRQAAKILLSLRSDYESLYTGLW